MVFDDEAPIQVTREGTGWLFLTIPEIPGAYFSSVHMVWIVNAMAGRPSDDLPDDRDTMITAQRSRAQDRLFSILKIRTYLGLTPAAAPALAETL
jgi:hypothetical protein